MSTALIEHSDTILLTVTPETVKELSARWMGLTVTGIDDTEGLTAVKSALKECVTARTTCEKEIAAVKEPHLRACQMCDATRREILALIAGPEEHLKEQAKFIEREQARQKQAELTAIITARRTQLTAAGGALADDLLGRMGQIEFDMALANARRDTDMRQQAELKRLADIEELKSHQTELQKQKAEFERLQEDEARRRLEILQDLKAQRDKLEAEQRRLDAEALERRRQAQEQAAAEKAAADRAALKEREVKMAAAAQEAAAEARKKAEAMRPDREKLRTVSAALAEIDIPEVGPDAQALANRIAAIVEQARYEIVQLLKE